MKDVAVSLRYNYAHTVDITRFVNRNDALLGSPWSTGLGAGGTNGVSSLTTVESTAHSVYNGITLGLVKRYTNNFEFQAFYTLSWDKSDDDNERDPFTLSYAKVTNLDAEYGYSDRDQRHRFNSYVLWKAPLDINVNASWQYRSAQPVSTCGPSSINALCKPGDVAGGPSDRNNTDGSVTQRNLGRKDNQFNSVNLRISRPFAFGADHGRAHRRGLQPLQQQEPQEARLRRPPLQLRRHRPERPRRSAPGPARSSRPLLSGSDPGGVRPKAPPEASRRPRDA